MANAHGDALIDVAVAPVLEDRRFESFVVDHWHRLVGLAEVVNGDITAAEDIVQTALERAWRSRRDLQSADRLRPWLDRIVVREAVRSRRKRLRWLPHLFRAPEVAELDDPVAAVEDAEAARFPEQAAIGMVLAGLTPAHRAVVVPHLYAGYTDGESHAGALRVDAEGRAWMAMCDDVVTWGCTGVASFDGATWTRHLADVHPMDLEIAPDGGVWVVEGLPIRYAGLYAPGAVYRIDPAVAVGPS